MGRYLFHSVNVIWKLRLVQPPCCYSRRRCRRAGILLLFSEMFLYSIFSLLFQGEEEQQETIATDGTITILSIEASYSTELQQRQPFNDDVHTFDSSDPKKFKVAFLNDQLQTKTHPELNNESKQTNCELSCSHYDPKSNIERGESKYYDLLYKVNNRPTFYENYRKLNSFSVANSFVHSCGNYSHRFTLPYLLRFTW